MEDLICQGSNLVYFEPFSCKREQNANADRRIIGTKLILCYQIWSIQRRFNMYLESFLI